MSESRPLVPTSSHLVPDEAPTTSSLVPPLKEGRGRGVEGAHSEGTDLVPTSRTRSEALLELMSVLFAHQEAGERIPCLVPSISDRWLSEDYDEQEAAALGCSTCPALTTCRRYVEEHPEPCGVWAGIVPSRTGLPTAARDRLAGGGRA